MSHLRMPRLLSGTLQEVRRLVPSAMSLELSAEETNQLTMTFPDGEQAPGMHDIVEAYTPNGSAGLYRVTSIERDYRKQTTLTLLHVIDILHDQIYPGAVAFSGTVAAFLADVLSKQTTMINGQACWVLGTCEDNGNYSADIKYDTLKSILKGLQDKETGFYFTYDTSSFPWVMNFVAKSGDIVNEFRLARNVQKCSVSMNDNELCTRLYVSADTDTAHNDGTTSSATSITVHNNTAAQAIYGIVAKTVGINTRDYPDVAAFAAAYLAERAQPYAQITIDGYELSAITGDTFDELKLGKMCRVALPDYGDTFNERIISVSYPDLLDDPERVTVELANKRYSVTSTLSAVAEQTTKTAAAQAETEKTAANYAHSTTQSLSIIDGTLQAAGIVIDANDGVFLFSKNQGALGAQVAKISVMYDSILHVVTTTQDGQTVYNSDLGTIQGSALWQNRDNITSAVGQMHVADALDEHGQPIIDEHGNHVKKLVIDSGGGLVINRNSVEYGLWDKGELTAGAMVQMINGQSLYTINADRVNITGIVEAQAFITAVADIVSGWSDDFACISFSSTSVTTGSIDADEINGLAGPQECTFSIDGTAVASFLGTADVNFDRAAAKLEGARTVTISASDIVLSDPYEYSNGQYSFEIEATCASSLPNNVYSDTAAKVFTFTPTDCINAVKAAVTLTKTWSGSLLTVSNSANNSTVSTAITLSIGGWSINSGHYEKTINVRADSADRVTTTINGDTPYNAGYNAGWAAAATGSGRSGNTVYYPSSTVDTFTSKTAHYVQETTRTVDGVTVLMSPSSFYWN